MALLLFGMLGGLWALCPHDYNRPNPLMDYVPQETGIYDTIYSELNEHACRTCHGNSTADRHHLSETALGGLCTPCHPTCEPGTPDCPNGILLIRNCTTASVPGTSGCHSWDEVTAGNQKWHHNTDMAASENCVACHNPNLVEEITPFRDHEMYPPSLVTPTPFSCENCHWEQQIVATQGSDPETVPADAGHPSTYEHYDAWGNPIGYFEYPKPIYGNFDNHHMQFQGYVVNQCYKCHSQDPNNPSWNPYDPELGRYCQICHSIRTLHTIGPHVSAHMGWEPVGFHWDPVEGEPDLSKTDCTDLAPTVYKSYTADEQCWGCHGDEIPEPPPPPSCGPAIDITEAGIQPNHGCCGVVVTLRGECFGEEHLAGYRVQVKEKTCCGGGVWIDIPAIHSWTDTLIEFEIPCYFMQAGNYWVRVKTPGGNSNKRVFTLEDCPSLLIIDPLLGACGTWIKFFGEEGDFSTAQEEMFDGYNGVRRVVDFVASSGTYTALKYRNWNEDSKERSFEVRFYNFFKDGIDPVSGERNFVQDDGSGTCPDEPTIKRCDCLALGVYSVYVKAVYFGDEDSSGGLSCGDTIFQVAKSNPVYFELTNDPIIYKLNPKQIELDKRLKIYGLNFGPTQEFGDEVRIGSKKRATSPDLDQGKVIDCVRMWSSTLIKVKMCELPKKWEGKTKYVWVEKDGKKSNYKRLKILAPLL